MKKAGIALGVLVAITVLTGAYSTGYHFGLRDDDRSHLHMNLLKDVYLYHEAESGDLAGVKSRLGFFTGADYDFYQAHFGGEVWSPTKLQEARRIATFAATNGSVVWITNGNPAWITNK